MSNNLKYLGKQLGIVILVLLVTALVFCIGLMIGYGVIGNGKDPWSILSPATWNSIIGKFTGQ
ncbi:MAG: DNA-directed RNA polymerase subunit beta [Streptococcus sp.]|nr:DNA-directed RNA polymerase subunit beta [Streptococcus sp.]